MLRNEWSHRYCCARNLAPSIANPNDWRTLYPDPGNVNTPAVSQLSFSYLSAIFYMKMPLFLASYLSAQVALDVFVITP